MFKCHAVLKKRIEKKDRTFVICIQQCFELVLRIKLKASLIRNEEIDIRELIDFLHTFWLRFDRSNAGLMREVPKILPGHRFIRREVRSILITSLLVVNSRDF